MESLQKAADLTAAVGLIIDGAGGIWHDFRLRMMAAPYGSGRGRAAASNYQMLQVLASGGAAVVQWKLESGRTHQIR